MVPVLRRTHASPERYSRHCAALLSECLVYMLLHVQSDIGIADFAREVTALGVHAGLAYILAQLSGACFGILLVVSPACCRQAAVHRAFICLTNVAMRLLPFGSS